MALSLPDCTFFGPALPEPFVKLELEEHLAKAKLLPKATGPEGQKLHESWEILRKKLRLLGEQGGAIRVSNHVLQPLVERLGYQSFERADEVATREGLEEGGWLLSNGAARLRAWAVDLGTDLDAPSRRGRAYRFSPTRIAQRVLLAENERLGLLSDGTELRLLICDPARPDSQIAIRLDRAGGWRGSKTPPDSYRLLLALASPPGLSLIGELTEKARLSQSAVTKKLREQAKRAVLELVQELYDDPRNRGALDQETDADALARRLWAEALVLVYRLLFILKLESSPDPARAFSFASTSLWRRTYSPNTALAPLVREVRDKGAETGGMLSAGLRAVMRLFQEGLRSSELRVSPLGGMLFGEAAAPLVESLHWSERAVAALLDNLLWTPRSGKIERERVHYGSLDVEDLGRVYEALLELEPGIATEPMCRLRRQKLEVVVPAAQGQIYRGRAEQQAPADGSESADPGDDESDDEGDDEEPRRGKRGAGKTRVLWVEEIPSGRFFLRVGLGRKATGSYYTPHAFVRFLVQETLEPQLAERSPESDPDPGRILELNVLDPAMGSGHFLVEACRYLGDKLYEACRLCDERALEEDEKAEKATSDEEKRAHRERALLLRKRVEDLPDPNDELVAYLPSHRPDGEESGLSQQKALALCRRLVAVHCLYGVDKNPLAVELAKVSLWLESYAEGLPLTFLDHRLIHGDSLTGPFFEQLLAYPGSGKSVEELHSLGVSDKLRDALRAALVHVRELEASVGKDVAEIEQKRVAKEKLDAALAPFVLLARTWSGGVMLGQAGTEGGCDDAGYEELLRAVAGRRDTLPPRTAHPKTAEMAEKGQLAVPYDLVFPEVFYPKGEIEERGGFDAVVGNPPWDRINVSEIDFWSSHSMAVLEAPTLRARQEVQQSLATAERMESWRCLKARYEGELRLRQRLFRYQSGDADGTSTRGSPDLWRLFAERLPELAAPGGLVGFLVPSSFHANEGGLALRAHYLDRVGLRVCFSFENHGRRCFDIDSRFKFDLIVGGRGPGTFQARFYLRDQEWLFVQNRDADALHFDAALVALTGGVHRTFVELTSAADLDVLRRMCSAGTTVGQLRSVLGIDIRQEINITRGASAFIDRSTLVGQRDSRMWSVLSDLIASGHFTVDDDKTFHQYTDRWPRWIPRYLSSVERLAGREDLLEASRHYRLAVRKTTGGRNERTAIFALLPPGHIATDKSPAERTPASRGTAGALSFLGLVNSFPVDWLARLRVQTDMNMFMIDVAPAPRALSPLVAHAALRLSCNHEGYAPLWKEQLGSEWREPGKRHSWPVLGGDDARWAVRAAIDAVVADAYGLSLEQYTHVLSTFSHKSYKKAPELCLAAFDELRSIGLEAFVKKHDPYADVPLVETLPEPVIDLAVPDAAPAAAASKRKGKGGRYVVPAEQQLLIAADVVGPPARGGRAGKGKAKNRGR